MPGFRPCGERSQYVLSQRYRCHHNTRNPKTAKHDPSKLHKRSKNSECPFSMTIKVKKLAPLGENACKICLNWIHNHPLHSLAVSTFRDILPETSEKVMEYFDQGLSPGTKGQNRSFYHESHRYTTYYTFIFL